MRYLAMSDILLGLQQPPNFENRIHAGCKTDIDSSNQVREDQINLLCWADHLQDSLLSSSEAPRTYHCY